MTLYHLFSTALLSTCLLVSTHGGPPKAEELIPPAQADLHFRVGGEDETSLLAALGAVAEASGTHFQMDSVTARGLRETAVGFDRDLTVPAEEAWAVIEQALLQAGYAVSLVNRGATTVLAVRSVERRKALGMTYTRISVDELELAKMHPAVLFEVNVPLLALDSRTLSNHLRGLRAEDRFTRSSSLGGRALLIRGVGSEVFSLASFCIESDDGAVRRVAEEQRKLTADSNVEGAR